MGENAFRSLSGAFFAGYSPHLALQSGSFLGRIS
jgi:hypothetical protein